MDKAILKIEGMHCDGCAERIAKLVGGARGVEAAEISYAAGEARIDYNPHVVTKQALAGVIEGAGFTVIGD
jgi:copper chaperone